MERRPAYPGPVKEKDYLLNWGRWVLMHYLMGYDPMFTDEVPEALIYIEKYGPKPETETPTA